MKSYVFLLVGIATLEIVTSTTETLESASSIAVMSEIKRLEKELQDLQARDVSLLSLSSEHHHESQDLKKNRGKLRMALIAGRIHRDRNRILASDQIAATSKDGNGFNTNMFSKFTQELTAKGRMVLDSLLSAVEGNSTMTNETDPNSIKNPVSAEVAAASQGNITLPDKNDGPRLSDAWLHEVYNEPNVDFLRLLGWDVYTYANHSITLDAQTCIEGAQAALYQLNEAQVLTFSNCAKLAESNLTNHNDCQCYAAHDRQGRAYTANVWQEAGCCTSQVLAFNEAAALINVNRSSVVHLQQACGAVCGAAGRSVTPSFVMGLVVLVLSLFLSA